MYFIHKVAVENLHTISGQFGGIITTFVGNGLGKPYRNESF